MSKRTKPIRIKPEPQRILTNQEKAELCVKKSMEYISVQIQEGNMKISSQKKIINNTTSKHDDQKNPLSLQSVEQSLKLLRANIQQQKREQKQAEKVKLLKAHELIVKIKKDKEQHKQKIQSKQEKSILHSRIFSQSTIGKMRERLQERISLKRKQIQERIKSIAVRQSERQNKVAGQQIQYWQKMKKVHENRKQSKSMKLLPSILKAQNPQRRKSIQHLDRNQSIDKLKLQEHYGKKIQIYLHQAKSRQQKNNLKSIEKMNEQRFNKMVNSNKQLAIKLGGNRNQRNQFIPSIMNKSKVYGDQYLKQSLLKIKKGGKVDTSLSEYQSQSIRQSIELQAHEKIINQNEHIQKMKENYDRMLSRIRHNQVSQQQGLDILNSMERRLDKVDPHGMKDRLKRKFDMLQKKEKQQNMIYRKEILSDSNQ